MEIELLPPGSHRRNVAKIAILNLKYHFLSILAGVADDFPLQIWVRLLPQAEVIIKLLRQSNARPIRLQKNAAGPDGMQGPSTQEYG